MAGKYLGPAFDIHGGGVDLRFPHHENEQAQSRAAGHPFASYWLHNAWITTSGEKMSKSLGNSLLIPSVLERVRGIELRFYIVAAHYRSHVEFSFEALDEAAAGFRRIENFLDRAHRPRHRPRRAPDVDDPPGRSGRGVAARGLRGRDGRRPRYAGRGRGPLRHRPRGQQAAGRRPVGRPDHRGPPGGRDARRARSRPARPGVADLRRLRRPADRGGRRPRPGPAHRSAPRRGPPRTGPAPTRSETRSRPPGSRSRTPRPVPCGPWAVCLGFETLLRNAEGTLPLARRGAIRKTTKKPTAGSGGRVKRGLEGKGPTPKAKDRPNHKVYKQKAKAEKAAAARPRRRTTGTRGRVDRGSQPGRRGAAGRRTRHDRVRRRGRRARRAAARDLPARRRARHRPARDHQERAGPADLRGRAPGARGQDPGLRVRPPRRPARPGRRDGGAAPHRRARLRHRPAQPRGRGAQRVRASARTACWSPSAGRRA